MNKRYGQVHFHFPCFARRYRFCKFPPYIAKAKPVPSVCSIKPVGLRQWCCYLINCLIMVTPVAAAGHVSAGNGKRLPLQELIIYT